MIIGIIGGGQLAWMLVDACHKLGHKTVVLDPNRRCSASNNTDMFICASYDDLEALDYLGKISDVVTYEFENIKSENLHHLALKYNMPQKEKPLYLSQNRIREKDSFVTIGIPTPKYKRVLNAKDLKNAIEEIGLPAILKTTTGGYDGKGQFVIKTFEDTKDISFDKEYIYEEMIDFDYEMSVIAVRSLNNDLITFPVSKNIHKNGILHLSLADKDYDISGKAKNLAKRYILENDLYGILTIEMFAKNDEIYFNEIAPRPHNSGHYTIDGCNMSQYEALCKAILGQPLEDVYLTHKTYMVNLLGQHLKNLDLMKQDKLPKKIYLYLKEEVKYNRKMGHITFIDCPLDDVLEFIKKYID